MTGPVWSRCGHPRTEENTVGHLYERCKTCRDRENFEARRKRAKGAKKPKGLIGESADGSGIFDTSGQDEAMRLVSRLLLRSLWEEHADILLFLEAAGRSVVRP